MIRTESLSRSAGVMSHRLPWQHRRPTPPARALGGRSSCRRPRPRNFMPHRLCGLRVLVALRPPPRVARSGSLLPSPKCDIKLSWSLPAAAASRRRGPRPPRRLQPPGPPGRHISRGRAQPTPLRLRLRSQPARFVAGLSFARTGTPALLPAAGAFVAVPLAAIAANAPQPQRPVRCSPTRCAVVDAYGPSLNASGRPVARA